MSYLPFLASNVYLQALMRDLMSKPKSSSHSAADSSSVSGSGSENAKKKTLSLVNDDFCGAILDTSFPRMLKKEKILPGTALSLGALELWSDDFEDKAKFGQYRSRLVCIDIYKVIHCCHRINYYSLFLKEVISVMGHLLGRFGRARRDLNIYLRFKNKIKEYHI